MRSRFAGLSATLLVLAVTSGCATNRSELKISSPVVDKPIATLGRTVVVRSVVDERVFEEAPKDPSTPSLGFGGANSAPPDIKARAIGRKRNGFGKAIGDVLLQPGQSVAGLVKENIEAALQQAGYNVSTQVSTTTPPLYVDIHIKQFWSWFQPGFWAITLHANIATDLILSDGQSTAITVHAEDSGMVATESSWLEIIEKALQLYRADAAVKAATWK